MRCNKFFIKKCLKGLDFSGQDEYNTLSTQECGVLNNPAERRCSPGDEKVLD